MQEHILTSGILISGIFLIRFLLGSHMQQRIKYALWLLVLAKLLLPMLSFETPYGMMRMVYAVSGDAGVQESSAASIAGSQGKGADNAMQNEPGTGIGKGDGNVIRQQQLFAAGFQDLYGSGVKRVCCLVWAVVSLLLIAVLSAANIRFARRLRSSRRKVLDGLCPLSIYEADGVSGPCLAGILHPAIYLPVGFSKESVCLDHVIVHEYMHYRHKDHMWALWRCICVCVYWFRPLVWAAAFASSKDGELACDEAAIAYLGEQERLYYGRTLIQAAAYDSRRYFSLPYAGSKNREMKGRISMIVKKPKAAAITCILLLFAVVFLAGAAFGRTDNREKEYEAEDVRQLQKPDMEKSTKESAWEYQVKVNADGYDGYFLNITDCRQEGGIYAVSGTSYADVVIVFTDEEKKRLDRGESVTLSCDGVSQAYTLSKNTQSETEGSYFLSGGNTPVGLELQKGQYGDRKGWILSDPYSGAAWQPLLEEHQTLSVAADTPVEVNNYYAYYEMFSSLFTDIAPDKGPENGNEQQWSMQEYFEHYLKNVKKLAKHGDWTGDMLAKVRVTGSGSSLQLTDFYLP